jgi:hypothetical protein
MGIALRVLQPSLKSPKAMIPPERVSFDPLQAELSHLCWFLSQDQTFLEWVYDIRQPLPARLVLLIPECHERHLWSL